VKPQTKVVFFVNVNLPCQKKDLDVPMTSPTASPLQNLQGASRITGGIIHGRALGNVFNMADADSGDDMAVPRTGKVHLYSSLVNPADVKPPCVPTINVHFSMEPILKSIAAKWSPIQSKHLFINNAIFYLFYQSPILTFCFEENEWNVKGRYSTAIEFNEDVKWIKQGNEYILPLCHVRSFYLVAQLLNTRYFRNLNPSLWL